VVSTKSRAVKQKPRANTVAVTKINSIRSHVPLTDLGDLRLKVSNGFTLVTRLLLLFLEAVLSFRCSSQGFLDLLHITRAQHISNIKKNLKYTTTTTTRLPKVIWEQAALNSALVTMGRASHLPQNYLLPWTDFQTQLPASSLSPSDLPSQTASIRSTVLPQCPG